MELIVTPKRFVVFEPAVDVLLSFPFEPVVVLKLITPFVVAAKLATRGFVAGRDEIFPIPYSELRGTLLVQNPKYN